MKAIKLTVNATKVFGFSPDKPAELYINSITPFDDGSGEPKIQVSTQLVQDIDGGQLIENRTHILPMALKDLVSYDVLEDKVGVDKSALNSVLAPFNVVIPVE